MTTPIYPEVSIEQTETSIKMQTQVRFECEGVWHLQTISQASFSDETPFTCEDKIRIISQFHQDAYLQALHKYDKRLVQYLGEKVYPKDENQETEQERIRKMFAKFFAKYTTIPNK